MRTISPRWFVIGFILLAWAVWSLADEAPGGGGTTGNNGTRPEIGLVD